MFDLEIAADLYETIENVLFEDYIERVNEAFNTASYENEELIYFN